MTESDWHNGLKGFVALQLVGDAIPEGENELASSTLLILINAGDQDILFPVVSEFLAAGSWQLLIDSANPNHTMPIVNADQLCPGKSVLVMKVTE